MKNQEVIKYACVLTGNKEGLLEFVYTLLTEYILKQTDISNEMFDSEAFFLKSLMKEVSVFDSQSGINMDPLHNQYINYIIGGDIKIFIPSKLYIFGPAIYRHDEVEYFKEQLSLSKDMLQAECVMNLGSRHRDHVECANEVLKILEDIKRATDQHISIAHLDWKYISLSNEVFIRQLAFKTLKISQNLTSICMWACKLPPPIYEHIVSQLQRCDNLQRLDLSECHLLDIGKVIAASKSLSDVRLYDSALSTEDYKNVAKELHKHKKMKRLHLNGTKGVPVEMADAVTGMKSLQVFRAKDCKMKTVVAKHILKSLTNCRELEELRLGMNPLTDCIMHLFPPLQNHPGFSLLKSLWINGTYLSRKDVEALSDALRANKLPQLEHLDLSYNFEIADTLGGLLNGTDHHGFPCLMYLDLINTNLTSNDLINIAEAVTQRRLPKLRRLHLGKNNLNTLRREHQVRRLVQSCINRYEKLDVIVNVFETDLSDIFVSELQSICDGSVVYVNKNAFQYDVFRPLVDRVP